MPANDLKLLIDAAHAAGQIARKFFQANPETWDKVDGQGPVTEADLAIDRMLHTDLLHDRPDYGWLSEETEDSTARLQHSCVFIVDPIDGTRAFIAGEDTFSHSLAIAQNGIITAAVVHLPIKGLTYSASLDGGAFLNGEPIKSSSQRDMATARILTTKPTLKSNLWRRGPPDISPNFRPSLAYRMCLAADGSFDGMVTLRDTWEWDVAAGDLIATEAGATVTTRENLPARYNNETPLLPGMIAAPKSLHTQFIDHL